MNNRVKHLMIGLFPLLLAPLAAAQQAQAESPADIEYLPSVGCIIEPSVRIEVSSPVEGVLDRRPVRLGAVVKKGDLLFALRSDVEAAAVELAEIQAEFARRHYQRNDDLYRDELISVHERDQFQTEYQVALKELQQTRAMLALRSVLSPIDGVVVDYFVESGEFVTNHPVLALASLDPLEVVVVMPYRSLGRVPEGSELLVYPAEPVAGAYPARVTMVDPIIDAASGTYRIRADIANPERKLPAGIECQVALK